nr:hypothetical protein [Tanacetum cinerariifolium]
MIITLIKIRLTCEEDLGLDIGEEERHDEEEEEDELYRDVNINQGRGLPASLEVKDSHVTLTPVKPDGQQESSSVSSQFVTSMLNPTLDVGMWSSFETTLQLDVPTPTSMAALPIKTPTMTSSTIATITTTTSQSLILSTTVSSDIIQHLPSFGSLFRFDDRLRSLEENFSEFSQTNQFAIAVSSILRIVKEQVKAQVSKILPKIEQAVNEQLVAEVLTRSSHSSRTSYAVTADLSEMELKKILIEKMKGNKSIQCSDEQRNLYKDLDEEPTAGPDQGSKKHREGKDPESASALTETATRSASRSTQGSRSRQASASKSALAEEPMQTTSQMEEPSHPEFDAGADDQPIVQSSLHPEWFSQLQKPPTLDRDCNKTLPSVHGSIQLWISELAKQADTRSSFNELMDTPLDFSNFIMNRLRVDTLTLKLLAGPNYDLMKGSCKSLIELEYHLDKPLPLIPDNQGRRVIPFAHFINNDLEYLRGGASSRKYTTSVMKTKAADYRHIKWIKDLVPRAMWTQEPIDYDKHALWGVSHWGRKRDYKRLRIQDIEDMLLLLVQGKLTNLTVEECFAFNVSLRMFTRSVVIQRRVEDLQLGVESYQKRLNLTKPDTYRSDLKRKEAYIAYSNPRGFIYQNKDKKNRLMRIDILYKFSDGTLTDVRTALDDRLKGIRMRYLPQTIWRKSDKDKAAAMIQAIDKRLKTRRIMRSLERFVGGRLYEGDFRMLQRTI